MPDPASRSLPIPPPTPAEAAALASAACYLKRAGTEAASRLLVTGPASSQTALFEALRDQLLAGAALCDGLIDLTAVAQAGGDASER